MDEHKVPYRSPIRLNFNEKHDLRRNLEGYDKDYNGKKLLKSGGLLPKKQQHDTIGVSQMKTIFLMMSAFAFVLGAQAGEVLKNGDFSKKGMHFTYNGF